MKIGFHNMCGCGNCKAMECKGCCRIQYYLVLGKKEFKTPKIINKGLGLMLAGR